MTVEAFQQRGRGYVPDRRHLFGLPVRDAAPKLAALPAPPESSMVVDAGVVDVIDQGGAPFCFANAPAQALRTCQVLRGVVSPRLASRLFLVYLTHAIEGDPTAFDGAMIGDVMTVLEKLGFPPETSWPYSDANPGPFSVKPPTEAFREAYDRIAPFDYARILSVGDQRITDIKTALAAGHPVVFGTQVTEAFCQGEMAPDFVVDAPGPDDPIAGGHALMLSGYQGDNFRVVNSWGPGWADGGKCWFTGAYLKSPDTEDCWIMSYEGTQP